jgi:CheY-like chemotaxis protein
MLFDSAVEALGTEHETAHEVPAASGLDLSRLRGARILLVEDNELNQEVALGLLEDAKISIDLAANGEDAVRMVDAKKYDLVLMDMQMPVMDGLTATKAIRAKPQLSNLPIIAMTANVMAADREKCIEAGMNDHVAKPIDPEELFTVLLRWIKPGDGSGAAPERPTPAASASAVARVADAEAIAIPGIDTKAALRRAGGSRKRYESLLRKFAQPSPGGVEEIRKALAAGDTETAARAAHSIKGSAANLGATAVAEVAAKAESAILSGQGVDEALRSLAACFDTTAAAIRAALPSDMVASGNGGGSVDAATILEPLMRLKTLLKNDDGEAADFILDARPDLSRVLTEGEINTLAGQVGNFDFAAALHSLSDIAARLSLKLE